MTRVTRAGGAIAAACLLAAAACSGDGDDGASASASTAAPARVEGGAESMTTESTAPPAPTEPEADDPPVSASPTDVALLDFELQPVPAGQYRVETIGAPFLIDIPEGWWVQWNALGHFVITDADSEGPGDRDIVMIRPSNLSNPDQPQPDFDETGQLNFGDWSLDDIDGWLDALIPGVVDGAPVDTTIGGLGAVQFDVSITDEVECDEAFGDEFCVSFATNRLANGLWFDRGTGYRVWWIDGAGESPIAISIGEGSDAEFTARAQAVLDTMIFESVGPNPIPSEANLWELGVSGVVPAGSVTLPVGPGVTFEVSDQRFVDQDEFSSGVNDLDGPGRAVIFFPDRAFDGESLATVDDVLAALERDPALTATVVGTREVSGYEATEVDISEPSPNPSPPELETPPTFQWSEPVAGWRALPGGTPYIPGWVAPPGGTLWIMETPDGIAVIAAEWYDPSTREQVRTFAAEIVDSIVIGG